MFNRVPAEVWTAVDAIGVDATAVRLALPAYMARNAVSGGANTTLADERVNATVPLVRSAWASPIKGLRALSAGSCKAAQLHCRSIDNATPGYQG